MNLNKSYKLRVNREARFNENIITKSWISNLYNNNLVFSIYSFFEKNDIQKVKYHFNICGMLDTFKVKKYNIRILDYAIPQVCTALLSDNLPFLKDKYANLKYYKNKNIEKGELSNYDMDEMVSDGESTIFCHTIQQFIKNDIKTIERNLNIIETITLSKKVQSPELMKLDFEFYKALYEKNKGKCEEILEQFVSPKIHKRRNDDPLLSKYVSQPALGYAKLAWINGVEVDTNSPLIPKELLPIQPNDNYEIPYNFLKKI